MKVMSLVNDYGIDREKDKEAPSDQAITVNVINRAIQWAFPQGIASDKRRIIVKLLGDLEKAMTDNKETVSFNEYEYTLLKDAFEKATVPIEHTKVFTIVETALLDAKVE